MVPTRLLRVLLYTQGSYTLITAIWPLIDIGSFMAVTGSKTDIWLVKTVAVLLLPIGSLLLLNVYRPGPLLHVLLVGSSTSFGLACIDFYYSINRTISWIYAADGVLELLFVGCWIVIALKAGNLTGYPQEDKTRQRVR